jgi:urease accessory protein
MAAREGDIALLARRAAGSTLDELGSATVQADIVSLRHETQSTRLFRS